jgi:hypothetical protein
MLPWLFILFICVFDFGFYAYAAICTQNAARAAAMRAAEDGSSVSNTLACTAALGEMTRLPNAANLSSCVTSAPSISSTQPVAVSVQLLTAATNPTCADCALNATATSAQASVTYQTIPMLPIPGMMMGQMTLTRVAEARINQ